MTAPDHANELANDGASQYMHRIALVILSFLHQPVLIIATGCTGLRAVVERIGVLP